MPKLLSIIRGEVHCADVMPMNLRVVVNRNAVTSRGPETAIEFALALVERLYCKEKMEEVDVLLVSCKRVGGAIHVNEVDKQLFRACTRVQLGNGGTAQFWESSWLDGRAPRDIALLLYKLAWRKKLKVRDQLVNHC